MSLEQGIGPINFGVTQVELCDGLNELSSFEIGFIKVERVTFALIYLTLLSLAVYNIYFYLWKGRLYYSFPLVVGYFFLVAFSVCGIAYETYMGFGCG